MILDFAGFVVAYTMTAMICTRTPTGNYINSRKKHEKEVMHITHELNRLDQSNLGFMRAFLFAAINAEEGNTDIDVSLVAAEIEKRNHVMY